MSTKQLKLQLAGTPDMVIACVMDLVKALVGEGLPYKCLPRIGGAPDWSRSDRTTSARCDILITRQHFDRNDEDIKISTLELRVLPGNKTSLGVEEPQNWDSPLGHFLGYLVRRFRDEGFVHFEEKKPPIGFRLPHEEKDV